MRIFTRHRDKPNQPPTTTMNTEEAIAFLMTPVCKMTDEDVITFHKNRDLLNRVKGTVAYADAVVAEQRRKAKIPGATFTPHLDDHITHKSGQKKTVCTSAALAFFNIAPDRYHYSGHTEQDNAILRRHGWSVRSRKSAFGVKGGKCSLGKLRKQLACGKGEANTHYKVSIKTSEGYHCIVLSPQGQVVVDTAAAITNNYCKVCDIYAVTHK